MSEQSCSALNAPRFYCGLCFKPLIMTLHLSCAGFTIFFENFLRSILLRSKQAVTLPMHSGGLGAWKSLPLSNVVFLRLAFSCFPGGQVAKLFQDSSLGNAVNIVVTRLILLMEDQVKSTKLSLLLFFFFLKCCHKTPAASRLSQICGSLLCESLRTLAVESVLGSNRKHERL